MRVLGVLIVVIVVMVVVAAYVNKTVIRPWRLNRSILTIEEQNRRLDDIINNQSKERNPR